MEYPSPRQPGAIKLINRIGNVLIDRLGVRRPKLDRAALMAQASKKAGLEDFGDPSFVPALDRLIEAFEREAQLSLIGRIAVKAMLLDNLDLRLQLTEYRKRRPEVAAQKIERPLFILGLPRTGTTILYELLAQDPDHRAPMSWEVAKPLPPARAASFTTDPRIGDVEKALAQTELLAPGFKAIHEIGATLPQECVAIQASHFISDQYGATFYLPAWRRWSIEQDMTASYRWHAQFLQHLQVDYRKPRWVLKTPGHLPYLDAIVAQYPDAAIVQTHRDPMAILGSISSLACTLHSAFSNHIDPVRTARAEVDHFARVLQLGTTQRDAMADSHRRFYDINFTEIVSDPISAIEAMYRHFDFEFTAEARSAMKNYLDSRPRDKHGTHTYTLQQFGLSRATHAPLFKDYCQRFGLES